MQNNQCKMQNADGAIDSRRSFSEVHAFTKPYDLSERFLEFADRVCSVVEALPETRVGRRIADQLLRSGTSPLGNYEEACAAESRRDSDQLARIIGQSIATAKGVGKKIQSLK